MMLLLFEKLTKYSFQIKQPIDSQTNKTENKFSDLWPRAYVLLLVLFLLNYLPKKFFKFCMILKESAQFCTILGHYAQFCAILRDFLQFCDYVEACELSLNRWIFTIYMNYPLMKLLKRDKCWQWWSNTLLGPCEQARGQKSYLWQFVFIFNLKFIFESNGI